jgi:hypothetical protein
MRWAEHVACIGVMKGADMVMEENLREGDQWGDPGIHGRIISGWVFGKWDVGVWTGWS